MTIESSRDGNSVPLFMTKQALYLLTVAEKIVENRDEQHQEYPEKKGSSRNFVL
jgi:hypothetical protein